MNLIHLPHVCDTPRANSPFPTCAPLYPAGAIWQCNECGTYWRYRELFAYRIGEWKPVRFWNLLTKLQIGEAQQ